MSDEGSAHDIHLRRALSGVWASLSALTAWDDVVCNQDKGQKGRGSGLSSLFFFF